MVQSLKHTPLTLRLTDFILAFSSTTMQTLLDSPETLATLQGQVARSLRVSFLPCLQAQETCTSAPPCPVPEYIHFKESAAKRLRAFP